MGILLLSLRNVSSEPLSLKRLEIGGTGVGSTIKVVRVAFAPSTSRQTAVAGGGWLVEPPGQFVRGEGCHIKPLEPFGGYELAPGAEGRAWVVIQGVKPGRYFIPNQPVEYEQEGKQYRQVMTIGYEGGVAKDAPPLIPPWEHRRCLAFTHLLNPQST